MAEKGKSKKNQVQRKAGDDDKHVHTEVRKSNVTDGQEHIYISAVRAGAGIDSRPTLGHLRPSYRDQIERQAEEARKRDLKIIKERKQALKAVS